MEKTIESNSSEKFQLSVVLGMVLIYALFVVLTFQLKTHVFILISVPLFFALAGAVKKRATSERVKKLISKFKLVMLFTVIMAVCILILTGPAPANVDPSLLP